MLRGINPLLNPDVLHALAAMGHGDTLAIVDSNFPGFSTASHTAYGKLLRMDCPMPEALEAVLSIFPIDSFVEHPVNSMQVVGDAKAVPEVIAEAAQLLDKQQIKIANLERFKFYEATKQSFTIIQTTESRIYANLILSKGVITK